MSRAAMISAIQRVQAPLMRRLRALTARATIRGVADGGKAQVVQITVLAGERISDVQRLQHFGFSAVPPEGSTCLLISIGGSRTHCVVIGADHESRPRDLQPGEAQVYNEQGDFVWFKASGETLLKARSKAIVDAPEAEFTGNVTIDGTLHVVGDVHFDANLLVDGDTSIGGDLSVLGDADIAGELLVDRAVVSLLSIADPRGTLDALRVAYDIHTHYGVNRANEYTDPTDTPA